MFKKVNVEYVANLLGLAYYQESTEFSEIIGEYLPNEKRDQHYQDTVFYFGASLKLCAIFNSDFKISSKAQHKMISTYCDYFLSKDIYLDSKLVFDISKSIQMNMPKSSLVLESYLDRGIDLEAKLRIDTFVVHLLKDQSSSPRGVVYWIRNS